MKYETTIEQYKGYPCNFNKIQLHSLVIFFSLKVSNNLNPLMQSIERNYRKYIMETEVHDYSLNINETTDI